MIGKLVKIGFWRMETLIFTSSLPISVADCGSREFTEQKRFEMSVAEFINRWLNISSIEQGNHPTNKLNGKALLYLKDWHFVKEYQEYTAYETPQFFRDDWLNLYLDHYHMHENPDAYQNVDDVICSDYRFVYMGAKGTWTPFHADVFRSYSWSANVCGKKKWYFLSPEQRHLAFDRNMKRSVYDIFEEVSEKIYPNFKKTLWLECTQDENELIFVPSGWYHQVHNLEDTISINHNWFNAYNLSWVWDLLYRDYKEAAEYIEDIKDICDDYEGLCQRNLAANTGMNFYDFFNFIVRFSFANIVQLCHLINSSAIGKYRSLSKANNLIFNLESAKDIAIKMKLTCLSENHNISLDFKSILEEPTFLKLCSQLERTYASIHDQHEPILETKKDLMDELVDTGLFKLFSSVICNPENLVSLIDDTLLILKRSFV
ncbi:arginine-specific demethylase JMJ20 isoform X2 [Rutidosis leptorrhynchoides]|uniref:arginine-specific demethylase JMJ20 isoform X2 n=1 Tax=Rutidosis leptorrhynchoides TaxID=125765 RepID=UPI003A99B161